MNLASENIIKNIKIPQDDIDVLKKHFSHCFDKNGSFDFDKFKKELSKNEEINFSKESYGMEWLGKSYARLLATDEARTLLKEDKKFNQKAENRNSKNLLLKGDNLEILKHLSSAYHEKVKMIYIDPPYNTGDDGFVYEDDRKFTANELAELAGIDEDKAKRILDFTDSKSNSHSAWLTFMYPRLYIAKQLLKEDGVIFISIDDNEVAQLKLLMDDIFGEENFVANLVRKRRDSQANLSDNIAPVHEYVLVFAKHNGQVLNKLSPKLNLKDFKNPDNDPRGAYVTMPCTNKGGSVYEVTLPNGRIIEDEWRFKKETFDELIKENKIVVPSNGEGKPRYKLFLEEKNKKGTLASTWLDNVASNQEGSREIKMLFQDLVFSAPKPIGLLVFLLNLSTTKDSLVLDFFAGSGTTAHAVMQLNAEDGGNRKFIMAQLPEIIDPKIPKNKTAFDFVKNELKQDPTIFEITKERIIRSAKKIQEENVDQSAKSEKNKCGGFDDEHCASCKGYQTIKIESKKTKDLSEQDFGFKIFETTSNNAGVWEDYTFEAEKFSNQIKFFNESALKENDLKNLLTTWKTYDGIELPQDLEEIDFDGYWGSYFSGKLYLMNKDFKTKNLKNILEKIDEKENFNPTTIVAFGYNFESKNLKEINENIKSYSNKKNIDIDFVIRY